jgi:hypothetical protein
MAHDTIAMRVRMRPLMPDRMRGVGDMEYALRQASRVLMRRLKSKLMQTPFSPRAKSALAKAMKIEIKPKSLVVIAKHPAFQALIQGRRRRQMMWLRKARTPIPIITETGKLIFRSANARSLTWRNGPMTGPNVGAKKGWVHPGRPQSDFVERAKQEAREFLTEKFKKEMARQIRESLTKRR